MALGPDDFARIACNVPSSDPFGSDVAFVQCADVDCNNPTETVINGASDNAALSVAVGADGTAYIAYDFGSDNYDNVSAYDEQGIAMATCSGGSCSSSQIAFINVFDLITAAITMGADGDPVMIYEDSGNTTTTVPQANSVHYYANGTDTVISSNGEG